MQYSSTVNLGMIWAGGIEPISAYYWQLNVAMEIEKNSMAQQSENLFLDFLCFFPNNSNCSGENPKTNYVQVCSLDPGVG